MEFCTLCIDFLIPCLSLSVFARAVISPELEWAPAILSALDKDFPESGLWLIVRFMLETINASALRKLMMKRNWKIF